jgi:hypothetical protein
MKICFGVEIYKSIILDLALRMVVSGEIYALTDLFLDTESVESVRIDLVSPNASLEAVESRDICCPCWELIPGCRARRFTD